jgi:hypothetical protein
MESNGERIHLNRIEFCPHLFEKTVRSNLAQRNKGQAQNERKIQTGIK